MKLFSNLVMPVVVGAVVATNALAQTSGPFVTSTPIPATLTDFTGTLSFPQFDASLGTLTSVTLDFSSGFSSTLSIENNSLTASSGHAFSDLYISVEDVGNNFLPDDPQISVETTHFSYSLGAGGSISPTVTGTGDSGALSYTAPAVLSEFTGGGNIVLDVSTLTTTTLSNFGGNTSSGQVSDASVTGNVTYNFEVPEPSTIAILALGFVGVLPCFRRRRQ